MSNYLNGFPIRTSVSRILRSPGARHNDCVGQSQARGRISGVLTAKPRETPIITEDGFLPCPPGTHPNTLLTPQFCVRLEVSEQLSARQHAFRVAVRDDGKLAYVVSAH